MSKKKPAASSGKPTKLITLQTAAAEYGPPYTSLRDLVIKGLLPHVRLGDNRRIWVRREDLERLITQSMERGRQ